jgi:hypothetical protein
MRTLGSGAQQAMPGNRRLDQIAAPAAAVDMGGQRISNLLTPGASSTGTDAATKTYVDSMVSGISLSVQNQNTTVVTATTLLDFQGAGVSTSMGNWGEAIITVPGSGETKVNLTTLVSPSSGWSISSVVGLKMGSLSVVTFRMNRTGVKITGGTNGNIADTPMFVLYAPWRPNAVYHFSYTVAGTSPGTGWLAPDGTVSLLTLHNTGTISVNEVVTGTVTYASA